MSDQDHRNTLLQNLITAGRVTVSPLLVRTNKNSVIMVLRRAIDNGTLAADDLETLIERLPPLLKNVMIYSLGLRGQMRRHYDEVADLTCIRPSMVPERVKDAFHCMVYCLQSADPTFNPFATLPVTSTPTQKEFAAQIHLFGMKHKYQPGDQDLQAIRLVHALLQNNWLEIDDVCSHTNAQIKESIGRDKKQALALLWEILSFFEREPKPSA